MSSKEKKILVSGNPNYGVAKALAEVLTADFLSRSNGYDLLTEEGQTQFVEKSRDYDVFINLASLSNFSQVTLLKRVWSDWSERGVAGHIISLGSTVDRLLSSGDRMYSVEKSALNRLSRQLALATHDKSKIRVTLVSPGMLTTPGMEKKFPEKSKINVSEVAFVVNWVIASPEGVNINEVSLDPMQNP